MSNFKCQISNKCYNIGNWKLEIGNSRAEHEMGFTLIELVIAFGILAILTTFFLTVVDPISQIEKANDGKRKSELAQVQRSLEEYYNDNGRYPQNSINYEITTVDANDPIKEWGTSWQPYMDVLPKDPSTKRRYIYVTDSNGQAYYLYASLERGVKDPQVCNGGLACLGVPSGVTCGGSNVCNYGISSPNVSP